MESDMSKLVDQIVSDDDDDEYDDIDDDEGEEVEANLKVLSLFDENRFFDDLKSLYRYEMENNGFNLVEIIKKFQLDMLSYIKMINFIRKTKPTIDVFNAHYNDLNDVPWISDDYFQTVIEDDPLLQFDIDEDLHLLGLNDDDKAQNFQIVNMYENRLKNSESRIEELSEMVQKLRSFTSDIFEKVEPKSPETDDEFDPYFVSYSNYSIHLEMLQDKVRTESYMNSILKNQSVFRDKVVLDVGCGTGILSLFAAKAGAKLVIAVDMSDVIDQAIKIAEENGFQDKIVFLKGKVEEVKLPVEKVDIIISEWMGYFLIYESMLDSVLVARDKYLNSNGIVLPNNCEMEIFGVSDTQTMEKNINFWSDVYGFKMNCMRKFVLQDAQIMNIKSENVVTDFQIIKSIDCQICTLADIAEFSKTFSITVNKDTKLTGLGVSFNINFNSDVLETKINFSTDPFHTPTHWEQTYFQLDKCYDVKKGLVISGEIDCKRNPNNPRSYLVNINLFENVFHYRIE